MSNDLKNMSLNDLRKMAVANRIVYDKSWKEKEFITAFENQKKEGKSAAVKIASTAKPEPGYARIKLHQNTESTVPIRAVVNNYIVTMPKNIPIDVPIEVLYTLQNSTRQRTSFDDNGKIKYTTIPAYPHEVIDINGAPGESGKIRPSLSPQRISLRRMYREIHGRYPKRDAERQFERKYLEVLAEKKLKAGGFEEHADVIKSIIAPSTLDEVDS